MGQHKNNAQVAIFVAFMEKHPDLARGFVKGDRVHFEQLWVELTEELNASGPPKKETVAWKKVWSDLRLSVKQRLAHNKVEVNKTGGGLFNRYVISPADEQIAVICGLYTSVDGVENSKTYGVPSKVKATKKVPLTSATTSSTAKNSTSIMTSTPATTSTSAITSIPVPTSTLAQCEELLQENASVSVDLPVIEMSASIYSSPTTSARTKSRKRKRPIADVNDVLDMETEQFSKMSANLVDIKVEIKENRRYLKEIALNIKDVRDNLKEIKKLKEKKLKEVIRHNFVIEKNLQTRNEIKIKFLELEEIKLGIKPSTSPPSPPLS